MLFGLASEEWLNPYRHVQGILRDCYKIIVATHIDLSICQVVSVGTGALVRRSVH
uniref:Uncharacterized protein n=1 Tax=Physcomitrium patens TaxID=3218 RepID=A0A2K1J483_PHYPA|nr:hypothetical protein PHYPA_022184 [Physcomitrium patens]